MRTSLSPCHPCTILAAALHVVLTAPCPAQGQYGAEVLRQHFGTLTDQSMGDGYQGVAFADVNKDGYADLIVGSQLLSAGRGGATVYSGKTGAELIHLDGTFAGEQYGACVAGAGDVNNDAYQDWCVGGPSYGSGRLDVISGKTGQVLWALQGQASGDAFGRAAAGVGDLDGDGFADFVVGAPGANAGAGRTYLFSGATGTLLFTANITAAINPWTFAAGENSGHSLLGAGDIDLDGKPDFLIGATNGRDPANTPTGWIKVVSGATGGILATLYGGNGGGQLGYRIAAADLDKDGYTDIIGGAPPGQRIDIWSGQDFSLRASIFNQPSTVLNFESFGYDVATGDVNKDGYPDIVVGAPDEDLRLGMNVGDAYVYSGKDLQLIGLLSGEASMGTWPFLGANLAVADIDKDGYADVAVAAPGDDRGTANAGSVTIYSGKHMTHVVRKHEEGPQDLLGYSVAILGDLNADGCADYAAGVPYGDRSASVPDAGIVRVYSGKTGGILRTLRGDSTGDVFGGAVAGAGDVNGDGVPDILVGAPYDDNNGLDSGMVRVVSGSDWSVIWDGRLGSGAAYRPGLNGAASDLFGSTVAGIGDVNSDGRADFAVGTPTANSNGGYVKVFSGATGLQMAAFNGGASEQWGMSIAALGDFNGDSVSDFGFGGPGSASGRGGMWIVSGATLTLFGALTPFTSAWRFGTSMAGLGDVNGDGLADCAVGLPNYVNPSIGFLGAAVIVYGATSLPAVTISNLTAIGDRAGDHMGLSVAKAGDVNGDGVPDLAVGSYAATHWVRSCGAVKVISGKDPSRLLAHLSGDRQSRQFSYGLAGGADVNGDGAADLVVGSPLDNGRVCVLSLRQTPLRATTHSLSASSGGTASFEIGFGTAHANRWWFLIGGLSGTHPGLTIPGTVPLSVPINFDSYSWLTMSSFPLPWMPVRAGFLDAKGVPTTQPSFSLTPSSTYNWLIGSQLYHVALVLNPATWTFDAASPAWLLTFRP